MKKFIVSGLFIIFVGTFIFSLCGCEKKITDKSDSDVIVIDKYTQFLNGNIAAQGNDDWFFINDMETSSLQPGINCYALLDINKDGISELCTQGYTLTVFTVHNDNIIQIYKTDAGFDTHLILKNSAIMSLKKSTGTLYRYTTFDNDLVSSTIEFFDAESYLDNAPYYFAGIKVTKKEYETLSKEYLELSKDLKSVYWYEYDININKAYLEE